MTSRTSTRQSRTRQGVMLTCGAHGHLLLRIRWGNCLSVDTSHARQSAIVQGTWSPGNPLAGRLNILEALLAPYVSCRHTAAQTQLSSLKLHAVLAVFTQAASWPVLTMTVQGMSPGCSA